VENFEVLKGWKRRHRKIWKLNVGDDDKNEEIKWKLSGFHRDKNFNSKIFVEFPVAFYGDKNENISSTTLLRQNSN
jgi:hypothetical protein